MIEVNKVFKFYQMGKEQVAALNGIDLKIRDGEFVAVVGPSGSGKSTLMHLIGGLDKPSGGSIVVDGHDISKLKDKELSKYRNQNIGFVFQSFNLEPSITSLENVMMPLMFAGIGEKKRKEMALHALTLVGLEKRAKHRPTELSGGERQRVSIARAIVNNPSILLADEPTGNLDSKTGLSIINLLKDLKEKGYTIIMVTHNTDDAKKADRIIKIKDGQIEGVEVNAL
ncbi:ABC transporter ATP-binding protein [Thermoanaerobacterium sp. RBIITD]|uniref:ABC transporter ATP-binding protein n=1 Tax=Thermoanaerobacterium sp. RBIITD TaxID=1550240 RepID=UPI000BB90D8C|nr:ABC transporter ATP-binding protein [Thermoanaerobacterium sp. RBIITD]SNX53965.1 putative ABC transport system ATP-binding protein [Thermoanaerobacterium sp. RBIITD]